MLFSIDSVMAGGTIQNPPVGPPEQVAAAVFIPVGKGVNKMTGYATQLAVHQGQISGQKNICFYIDWMRLGPLQVGMTACASGIGHRLEVAGMVVGIDVTHVTISLGEPMRIYQR